MNVGSLSFPALVLAKRLKIKLGPEAQQRSEKLGWERLGAGLVA